MRVAVAAIRYTGALILLAAGASFSPVVNAGQGVWTSGGPYGGTINALAINPTNPATVYASTPGGVFKSTNAGESWTAINTGLPSTGVGALVIDPKNPATLYVSGGGIFKSTNAGESWTAINTGLPSTGVGAVAINPVNPATLYAPTYGGGVFKSTNGGDSWTAINTGLTNPKVSALAIDPSAPDTLYAGTSYSGRVYKSSNGGESWTFTFDYPNIEVDALAIDPLDPSTLYAGLGSIEINGGVIKSTDGGAHWTDSLPGSGASVFFLAINPSAPGTVYAGTDSGLLKSTNGGGGWAAINVGLNNVSALVIDPSARATLYAGTAGAGVFKSSNDGETWTAINAGLTNPIGVSALAADLSASVTVYAGTSGGGVFKSTDSGESWTAINAGLTDPSVNALAIDPSAPAILYAGTLGGVFKSINGGASWSAINAGLSYLTVAALEVTALAIDSSRPATLYAGTWVGVFKSTNGGENWTAVNSGLTDDYHSIYGLAIDPSEPATLYALTNGGIFKSTNGGVNWTENFVGRFFSALAIDPSAPAILYVSSFGIFKSTDGGATWVASANTGLSNLGVNALAINPAAPATLYAGTGDGVFRSTDSGGTWAAYNSGLPNLPVNAMALDPTGATLYAGLEGGGVWQLTGQASGTITAILPASAHYPGANGAFYTTNVSVANNGDSAASFTLKFLGNNQDGSNGPEKSFALAPGNSTTFLDVLGSVFGQTSSFGAIRITSNSLKLGVVSVTSTPGFGGTLGQTIPAIASSDLIPAGSSRSVLYVREGDGFRSNLILASGASVSTDVDVAVVSPSGSTLATKSYAVAPNGMTQINRVVRDMGVPDTVTGARLVLSSSTPGAAFTGFVSVIDETTNDPTTVIAQPASVPGSAPYTWLLPTSARSAGASGAFYTTNVAVANVGSAPASFTMKFLGHDQDGSAGPEQTFNLESGRSVTYFDVLGTVFGQTSSFGAIRITSDSPALDIVSVTSTPGFDGTLSQTIPAVHASNLIPADTSRSILYLREGDKFRSNLVLASNASVPTNVDVFLISPEGVALAAKTYSVPPNGMTQINRIVHDMGIWTAVTGARLVLSSSTPGAAFTAFASVIDEVTNDPTTVEAR
jgi:photosystem II stability/assembly factor-like uncharacterized protein